MYLDITAIDKIRESTKPCIIPFSAQGYGGERPQEEINHLSVVAEIWEDILIQARSQNKPSLFDRRTDILCAGNLKNRFGLSLAKDMENFLSDSLYGTWRFFPASLLIAEENSCHTGHQVREMRDFILEQRYDLLILVSNYWHLKRICKLIRYWYDDIPILPIASPTSGSIFYRFFNAIKEIGLYLMVCTIDFDGKFWDRVIEKRTLNASQKP